MALVRYGQAAMIAAILTVTGNAVWAQQPVPAATYLPYNFCKDGKCCKEGGCCANSNKCDAKYTSCKNGQCYKGGECCSDSKKCDDKCTCCKDSKCACCKDGECGCDKNGKCSCGKDKTSATKFGCDCCPFMNTLAKHTAIIMVMPASMPLPPCCMEAMGMIPHPPMPPMPPMPVPGPHVWLPPPPMMMPPMPVHPQLIAGEESNGNVIYGYGVNSNTCVGGRVVGQTSMPIVVPCPTTKGLTIVAPSAITTDDGKVHQDTSEPYDRLMMCIGEDACIRAKKMTIEIGETKLRLSRFDNRVRVRGEELKATASCVHSDRKDHLILEGDVVLHYKKDGHTAHVSGELIELNLSNSTITIKRAAKTPTAGYPGSPGGYDSESK